MPNIGRRRFYTLRGTGLKKQEEALEYFNLSVEGRPKKKKADDDKTPTISYYDAAQRRANEIKAELLKKQKK